MDSTAVIESTRRWIATMVIGLDLCPFARAVYEADRIRYVVSEASDENQLLRDLGVELRNLSLNKERGVETTLLIHPLVLGDFLDYNEFLDAADTLLNRLRLSGVLQIASFHPAYQFDGTQPADVENYTNRSPHPMLHILREASVAAVANGTIDLAEIPQRNIKTLNDLGIEKVMAMRAALKADDKR